MISAISGKTIAVQTGTISGEVALSVIPDLKVDYFNTQTACLTALRAGKVDAWCYDEPGTRFLKTGPEATRGKKIVPNLSGASNWITCLPLWRGNPWVLNDQSLRICPGECVAVVGWTGRIIRGKMGSQEG